MTMSMGPTNYLTASQRALADVERVAQAIFANRRHHEPVEGWDALYPDEVASYRAMAAAAIDALGVREEQYRSANCPDDQDYDMTRLCGDWRPVNPT